MQISSAGEKDVPAVTSTINGRGDNLRLAGGARGTRKQTWKKKGTRAETMATEDRPRGDPDVDGWQALRKGGQRKVGKEKGRKKIVKRRLSHELR